jgi:hypothetical protein
MGNTFFYAGSKEATAACKSRYGIQDMVGNVDEYVSDQLNNCSFKGPTCVGVTSSLDPGNTDMAGFPFDDITAPGHHLIPWYIKDKTYDANYFSVPLGIPMKTDDGGNAILIDSWLTPTNKFHDDYFTLSDYYSSIFEKPSRSGVVGMVGRWSTDFRGSIEGGGNVSLGVRCTVPVGY